MSTAVSQDNATRTGIIARAVIYTLLLIFAVYYLLPLYVMVVNSLKPLEEIRQGNMLNLPRAMDHRSPGSRPGRLRRSACRRPASNPIS